MSVKRWQANSRLTGFETVVVVAASDYDALAAELAELRAFDGAWVERIQQAKARISALEAFLNRCYEESRAPYAEEMDNEHVPMPSALEGGEMRIPDNSKVICPACVHQFQAICVDDQARIRELTESRMAKSAKIGELEALCHGVLAAYPREIPMAIAAIEQYFDKETPVNPTMQHHPGCPALRGQECQCDPYPLKDAT